MLFFFFLIAGIFSFAFGMFFALGLWRFFFLALGFLWILSGVLGLIGSKIEDNRTKFQALVIAISKMSEQDIGGWSGHISTTNKYFIVFEFPDKVRKKVSLNASQYALILEGDSGTLEYTVLADNSLSFIAFTRQ